MHTLREEEFGAPGGTAFEGVNSVLLSLSGEPLSASAVAAAASPVSAIDFPMRENEEGEEGNELLSAQPVAFDTMDPGAQYSTQDSEVEVLAEDDEGGNAGMERMATTDEGITDRVDEAMMDLEVEEEEGEYEAGQPEQSGLVDSVCEQQQQQEAASVMVRQQHQQSPSSDNEDGGNGAANANNGDNNNPLRLLSSAAAAEHEQRQGRA